MITCQNCSSINVKITDANFARAMVEGQPIAKYTYGKYFFHCWNCEADWKSIPEAERDYFDYKNLLSRTSMIATDMGKDGGYGPSPMIDDADLSLRDKLAKKIVKNYKHLLNLDPAEWFEIEQDAK